MSLRSTLQARSILVCAVAIVAGTVGLSTPHTALAHAKPDEVRPGDGAIVTALPARVEIVMSQSLARQQGANDIDVFGADGNEVTVEAATMDLQDRRRLSVPLPPSLPAGSYIVRWKSLSADDGDPEVGELSFTFNPNGPPSPGRELLAEAPIITPTEASGAVAAPTSFAADDSARGSAWVLAAAMGVAGIGVGATVMFLLVQKRPRTP